MQFKNWLEGVCVLAIYTVVCMCVRVCTYGACVCVHVSVCAGGVRACTHGLSFNIE